MITAALRSFHSPDVSDLEHFVPDDPECFGFLLEAMFGPKDDRGMEAFGIIVCTPAWLALKVKEDEVLSVRNYLVVKNYNYNVLNSFLVKYATRCSGKTWQEVAAKLSQIGRWEFEAP
jgi:hypothetical protein